MSSLLASLLRVHFTIKPSPEGMGKVKGSRCATRSRTYDYVQTLCSEVSFSDLEENARFNFERVSIFSRRKEIILQIQCGVRTIFFFYSLFLFYFFFFEICRNIRCSVPIPD
ncbi:hypothetical protein PUN28_018846 [Cardiocondyla obscurior]|uniref:Uncharacterized protein n=1 Tax=Cardiocondyla obscurior TaxID=286306 RepID=A0AAW2EG64_9HYME